MPPRFPGGLVTKGAPGYEMVPNAGMPNPFASMLSNTMSGYPGAMPFLQQSDSSLAKMFGGIPGMGGMPNLSQLSMMPPFPFNPQLFSQLMASGINLPPSYLASQLPNKALGQMWMSQDKVLLNFQSIPFNNFFLAWSPKFTG